ncbi:unnamed protein product [Spodoptera littoralis]|uniref:beta-glucosidase n=1 Tax=Spodoptera littoralis TaxID=7109 RepID=A0A9P0IGA5_SPOLI|nr:unnamed protein product [Spodoptera littoralis]CAH1647057.1 unnamed protein product [Spodoptera littoralis]
MQIGSGRYLETDNKKKIYYFPDDFAFGVSTAAYQIEGAWNEGGKGESIWDKYLHEHPKYTKDGSNADIATDSYHKYIEDIEMIKKLGVRYYRTSLSWPRILPDGTDNKINKEGVLHYRTLFKELIKANITPVVTLYHWDMPTIFVDLGGWSNPVSVDYFEDYARTSFRLFGDLVKYWLTVNEPHQHCVSSYGGSTIPGLKSPGVALYLCTHNILLAHARVYHIYHQEFRDEQKGKITLSLDCNWSMPKHNGRPEDQEAAERHLEMHVGMFAHPIYSKTGDYPELVRQRIDNASHEEGFSKSRLPYFTDEQIEALKGSSDFFSLNHYTTYLIRAPSIEDEWEIPSYDHDTGVKVEQDLSWSVPGVSWLSVYAPGLRKMIKWITKKYGNEIPIIVTENGVSDRGQLDDYDRVSYFNEYLYELLLAIHEDGSNVKGYFAWSLMDNFEWDDGYSQKFGLYKVDFNDPKRKRTPKLSAKIFHNIVCTRTVDFNFLKPSPEPQLLLD